MPTPTRTTSREEIAANVRAAAARRRVEQAAIAELINRSPAAVSDRMNGKTNFRIDELQAIAGYLEVTLDSLLAPAEAAAPQGSQ